MAKRQVAYGTRWILTLLAAGILSAGLLAPTSAAAGKLEALDTSLKLIPADAAFYSAMLRNREQVELLLHSKAWARVMKMPVVQMGIGLFQMQAMNPSSPPGQFYAFTQSPQGKKALELAADLFSNDVFIYGGKSTVGFADLMQQVISGMRYGPVMMQLSGRAAQIPPDKLQSMLLFSILAQNTKLIRAPDVVIGFRLKNKELATEHLKMLETLLTKATANNPMLNGRFKRKKVGEHEYLTLTLDGSMVPWDQVPLDELRQAEVTPGDVDKVMAKLKKLTLVVSLGLRDDFLLLGVGPSTDVLANLGKGKPLAGRKEFRPLEKMADKRLTSISYMSKALATKVATGEKDIDDLFGLVDEILPVVGLSEQQQARVRKDAKDLAADVKRALPKPGASMSFSFLTDQGMEGYAYNWAEQPQWDGSKPLSLLEHVGGDPILAVVGRGKTSPEDYDMAVKWLKVAYGYFEDFVKPKLKKDERKQYEDVVAKVIPLLKRLDKANRTLLIPALADGQAGFVLDAKLTSKHFIQALPATEKAMPMVEPAVILGVSDAKALVKGMSEYRAVANELINVARGIEPGAIPPFKIPPPESNKVEGGTLYFYPLPEQWGVDKKILPNAGVGAHVAVISATRAQTLRLLATTPPRLGGVLKGAEKRPLATAAALNWAGLVKAVTPWVDYFATAVISQQLGDTENPQAKSIMDQVHTVLDVLGCMKTITSEGYFEHGAMVSHTLTTVEDLK